MDALRALGLNAYEAQTFLTLAAESGEGLTSRETLERAKAHGFDVPEKKINAALKTLERAGGIQRKDRPFRYYLPDAVDQAVSNITQWYAGRFERRILDAQKIADELKDGLPGAVFLTRQRAGDLYALRRDEARPYTYRLWDSAKDRILLMSSSADWLHDETSYLGLLEKKARSGIHVYALLASETKVELEKRDKARVVRERIKDAGGHVFSYEPPEPLRMNVVDGNTLELFMWPTGKEDPKTGQIFYGSIPRLAEDLEQTFYLKCLKSLEMRNLPLRSNDRRMRDLVFRLELQP